MTLRFSTTVALAACVLTLLAGAGASAQVAKPVSVQVGIGSQLSSSATDATSSTSFHAGASLVFTDTTTLFVIPGSESIDVDYNHASGHGGHFDAYGATYTNRFSLVPKIAQPLTAHVVPYVGFGIGVFDDQVTKQETTSSAAAVRMRSELPATTTTSVSGSATTLGGKLLVGIDTPTGVFVEASYIISGSAEGVRTDSLNLAVGMHL